MLELENTVDKEKGDDCDNKMFVNIYCTYKIMAGPLFINNTRQQYIMMNNNEERKKMWRWGCKSFRALKLRIYIIFDDDHFII